MKQGILLITLLFFAIQWSFAQPPGDHPPRRGFMNHEENIDRIIQRLDEQVSLTPQQEVEIREILEDTADQIKEIEVLSQPQKEEVKQKLEDIRNSNLSPMEKRKKMRAVKEEYAPQIESFRRKIQEIREESKRRINEVLTVEQKAILYEIMTEKKPRYKDKSDKKLKFKEK